MTHMEELKILQRIERRLLAIKQALDLNNLTEEEKNMAVDPKVAALIVKFDDATNLIAARIQKLIDAGGLSPESEAALTAEVQKLEALGADPNNPVPPDQSGEPA